jgi:hypothetical protein
MAVEIMKIKRNEIYGHFNLLIKEPDGKCRLWRVGEATKDPNDELAAIKMFMEEWNASQWRGYKRADIERMRNANEFFDPEDFKGTGLVVFD